MSIYNRLDEALIDNINSGSTRLVFVSGGAAGDEAASLAILTGVVGWRIIDRRLQALRKAGRISFRSRDGWTIPEQANQ